MMTSQKTSPWGLISLLACAIVGIAVRLVSLKQSFLDSSLYFTSPDGVYHLRRVMLALQAPGRLNSLDYYRGLESTLACIWPVQYDYALAGLSWLLTLGQKLPVDISYVIATLPILIGLGTAYVIFVLLLNRGLFLAACACFIFLMIPKNIYYSSYAELDHHAAEMLAFAFCLLCFIRTAQTEDSIWPKLIPVAVCSLFYAWSGSTLYFGILLGILFCWELLIAKTQSIAQALLWSAACLALTYPYQGQWNLFLRFDTPSLFQPLLVFFSGLLLYNLGQYHQHKKLKALALSLNLIVLPLLLLPIYNGLLFLKDGGDAYRFAYQIEEFQSLFQAFKAQSFFEATTPLILLGLIFCFVLIQKGVKEKDVQSLSFGLCFVFVMLLSLNSQRYLYMVTLMLPLVLIEGLHSLLKEDKRKPASLFLCSVAALTSLVFIQRQLQAQPILSQSVRQGFHWLKTETPVAGEFNQPHQQPQYSVSAPWDLGHYLLYYSQRPILSDNFGLNAFAHDKLLASQNAPQAEEILGLAKSKYVLLNHRPLFQNPSWMEAGEVKELAWVERGAFEDQGQRYTMGKFSAEFNQSLFNALYVQDALSGRFPFRLAYESQERSPLHVFNTGQLSFVLYGKSVPPQQQPFVSFPSRLKIFERVPGAQLQLKTTAGNRLNISAQIESNTGRKFSLRQVIQADEQGLVRIPLYYAEKQKDQQVGVIGGYSIQGTAFKQQIRIQEHQVQGGEHIQL